MEERIISFCGLDCSECPAYIGTQKGDKNLIEKTAKRWSTSKHKLEPDDIICDGCTFLDKRLASFCSECQVRICGVEKGVDNCGLCDDYSCERLKKVWKWIRTPKAKARLDEIKQSHEKGLK